VVGAWIVGGIGLSALSVIVYAAVINAREHRELTSLEAIGAMTLPFYCGMSAYNAFPADYSRTNEREDYASSAASGNPRARRR
jgi:hypothetical protein